MHLEKTLKAFRSCCIGYDIILCERQILWINILFWCIYKKILSYKLSNRRGDTNPYFDGLKDVIKLIKKEGESMAGTKNLATNKKARHEYFIEETYECGIELKGTEVKSLRMGRVNLKDGFASVDNSEVFLKKVNISP